MYFIEYWNNNLEAFLLDQLLEGEKNLMYDTKS